MTSILLPSGFALQKRLAESTVNVCQPRLSNELDMVAYPHKNSQKIGCLFSLRALMRDALVVWVLCSYLSIRKKICRRDGAMAHGSKVARCGPPTHPPRSAGWPGDVAHPGKRRAAPTKKLKKKKTKKQPNKQKKILCAVPFVPPSQCVRACRAVSHAVRVTCRFPIVSAGYRIVSAGWFEPTMSRSQAVLHHH